MYKVRSQSSGFTRQKSTGFSGGYTIVETMIFLAVSGALFLSAMLLVNGQQRKTEFSTSVRDFDSKLQSVIGNVTTGYYNNPGSITCVNSAGVPVVTPVPSTQGQNQGCTFIGQYIDLSGAGDKFTITSYAGLRLNDAGKEVQSLSEAKPTPISSTAEDISLPVGVTGSMKLAGTATNIVRLAITTTFNQYNAVSGNLNSGSSRSEMHAYIAAGPFTEVTIPPEGVQICLNGGDRVGIIVLNTGTTRVTIGSACP